MSVPDSSSNTSSNISNTHRRDALFKGHRQSHRIFSPLTTFLILSISAASKLLMFRLNSTLLVEEQSKSTNNNISHCQTSSIEDGIIRRPLDRPLLTVSNHTSTLDDPLQWSFIPLRSLTNNRVLRWSLAAHDVCFVTPVHSWLFSRLQSIPVIRGNGIYQPSIYHALDILNDNGWVHVFPEGRINYEPEKMLRFKWGVGRLALECKTSPLLVPIFHCGMDRIKPKGWGLPRMFQTVTIGVGEPFDMRETLESLRTQYEDDHVGLLIAATEVIQNRVERLQSLVESEHQKHLECTKTWRWWNFLLSKVSK